MRRKLADPMISMRLHAKPRYVAAALLMLFGIGAVGDWSSIKWIALTLSVYSLPLVTQFSRSSVISAYGLWFGAFLVLQTAIPPIFIDDEYITLQPDLSRKINVVGNAVPGIEAFQSITTDSMGFRVTKPIDYRQKPQNTFRVFAIGGSTTEQILLDDKLTWTHLLQERLSDGRMSENVEIVNTGVSGIRAVHHLSTFKRIVDFEPDLVVFMMGINDWNLHVRRAMSQDSPFDNVTRSIRFSTSPLGMAIQRLYHAVFLEEFPEEGKATDELVELYDGEYYSSQNDSLSRPEVRSFQAKAVLEEYRITLERIGDACKQADVPCMFVTQATGYHPDATDKLKRHFWMTPPNTTDYTLDFDSLVDLAALYNNHLLAFARERGHLSCDLASNMEPSTNSFYDDCHFNVKGAAHAAMHLDRCVIDSTQGHPAVKL